MEAVCAAQKMETDRAEQKIKAERDSQNKRDIDWTMTHLMKILRGYSL